MGLLWACFFHHHGFSDITISEGNMHRRDRALKTGLGFQIIHPKDLHDLYKAAIKDGNESWGFDVIIDCAGRCVFVAPVYANKRIAAAL